MISSIRPLVVAAFAAGAVAQNTDLITGLQQHLTGLGLTSLVTSLNDSKSSAGTMRLLTNVNGTDRTLLAPTNSAFEGASRLYPNLTNPTYLGNRLSYHLLQGNFPASSFAIAPNHTIARTFLNDPSLVYIEGMGSQAVAFAVDGGKTTILNQNTNVSIASSSMYQNLLIHVVDAVVDIPGNLTASLVASNLTLAAGALNSTQPQPVGSTLFVPNNEALVAASSAFASYNETQFGIVAGNNAIYGLTVYSTQLTTGSYTSGAGQPFTFTSNATGIFVTSGNETARIVKSDIIFDHGVIHATDRALLNLNYNPGAAQSAASAYSSTAAQQATQTLTGGIGATGAAGTGGGGGTGSNGTGAAGHLFNLPRFEVLAGAAGVIAGMAMLI